MQKYLLTKRNKKTYHPFVSSFAKLYITALTEGNALSARKTTEATRFAARNNNRVL